MPCLKLMSKYLLFYRKKKVRTDECEPPLQLGPQHRYNHEI